MSSAQPSAPPLLLLGAGASVEAGVPASFDMTRKLVEGVSRKDWRDAQNLGKALNFISGALMAYDAAQGISPYSGLDVERVFAAVELLAGRRDLEVSPFVASWHPAVDAWDRPSLPRGFDRNLQRQMFQERPAFEKGRDLVVDLIKNVTGGGTGDIYKKLADRMIEELHRLVVVTPKRVEYLRPLAALGRKQRGITVATLNYDRSVELACADQRVRLSTGIESWSRNRVWDWRPQGVRLLKLHGSIDWKWQQTERVRGHLPTFVVEQATESELDVARADDVVNRWEPALVFGQRGKLRAAGPFLSLLAEFEAQLEETDHIIVIGYSFRDDHVNEIISRWTAESLERRMTIVDIAFPERPWNPDEMGFRDRLLEYLNPRSNNQEPDVERITLKEMPASQALAELIA